MRQNEPGESDEDVFRRASDKSAILEMWHDVIVCDYSDRGDSDICN